MRRRSRARSLVLARGAPSGWRAPRGAPRLRRFPPRVRPRCASRCFPSGSSPSRRFAIARDEGYFRAQGLDVELVPLVSSADATPSLIRGDLDVVAGVLKIADFNAIARGAALRFVADKDHFEPGACVGSAFVARPGFFDGKGADDPARLRGARVATTPLHFMEYALETLLGRKGLTLDDLKLARLPGNMVAEAFGGRVARPRAAVGAGSLPRPSLGRGRPLERRARGPSRGRSTRSSPSGRASSGRTATSAERFLVAYLQGVRQYNRGKTERNLDLLAAETGVDRELLRAACWPSIRGDGKIDVASVLEFQRWAVRRGALDAVVPPERFWDPSFADEAGRILGPPAR